MTFRVSFVSSCSGECQPSCTCHGALLQPRSEADSVQAGSVELESLSPDMVGREGLCFSPGAAFVTEGFHAAGSGSRGHLGHRESQAVVPFFHQDALHKSCPCSLLRPRIQAAFSFLIHKGNTLLESFKEKFGN